MSHSHPSWHYGVCVQTMTQSPHQTCASFSFNFLRAVLDPFCQQETPTSVNGAGLSLCSLCLAINQGLIATMSKCLFVPWHTGEKRSLPKGSWLSSRITRFNLRMLLQSLVSEVWQVWVHFNAFQEARISGQSNRTYHLSFCNVLPTNCTSNISQWAHLHMQRTVQLLL